MAVGIERTRLPFYCRALAVNQRGRFRRNCRGGECTYALSATHWLTVRRIERTRLPFYCRAAAVN
jgi:hypothetical protein